MSAEWRHDLGDNGANEKEAQTWDVVTSAQNVIIRAATLTCGKLISGQLRPKTSQAAWVSVCVCAFIHMCVTVCLFVHVCCILSLRFLRVFHYKYLLSLYVFVCCCLWVPVKGRVVCVCMCVHACVCVCPTLRNCPGERSTWTAKRGQLNNANTGSLMNIIHKWIMS